MVVLKTFALQRYAIMRQKITATVPTGVREMLQFFVASLAISLLPLRLYLLEG